MIEEDDLLNEDAGCDAGCIAVMIIVVIVALLLAGWLGK